MNRVKLIRKSHRYLGIFLGIQFLFWTISGLYFSWTNIDEIHGDHFKKLDYEPNYFTDLVELRDLNIQRGIQRIELRDIDETPYYWINNEQLFNAITGEIKDGVTKEDALRIAEKHVKSSLVVKDIELVTQIDNHHEYRGRILPAYVISYLHEENVKAYVSKADGKFQTVRYRGWRWFDFLWMTHTMDYQGRDNFNSYLLRIFSLMGLITIMSGFILWFDSSPTLRRIFKKKKLENIKA